jgi:hypothetical protein
MSIKMINFWGVLFLADVSTSVHQYIPGGQRLPGGLLAPECCEVLLPGIM